MIRVHHFLAQKRIHVILQLALTLLLLASPFAACYAEGYGDYFLYDLAKLPRQVLADTIGLVTIHAEFPENSTIPQRAPVITRFRSYERNGNQFAPAKEVLVADTLPVGAGGYGGWFRYLVTEWQGEYLQIIIDPYKDKRTWINPDKAKEDRAIIFTDLIGLKRPVTEEIDIFLLSTETKLYTEPRSDASFKVLYKKELQHKKVFYPIAFTKEYIQIGLREKDPNDPYQLITIDGEPLGWIQARDEAGRVAFHLFMYAWN